MNSDQIFSYSEDFMMEIINNLTKLKHDKINNPKSNEFENKLKKIIGKNYNLEDFNNLISNDIDFKKNLEDKFKNSRDERIKILGENQAKK